jgi:hypothetical protein
MHIESAINSLENISLIHSMGVSYDDSTLRNQVDGLVNHAFDHVMKAQTHDERGDYKAAHSALVSGTSSAMKAIDRIHANSSSYDLSGHKITLDQAPTAYKHENFS